MKSEVQDDPDAATQRKVQNMRSKLSMAKGMLEELLAERDELDRAHDEEMTRLEATLNNERQERERLKQQVGEMRKQVHAFEEQIASETRTFEEEISQLKATERALRGQIATEKEAHKKVQEALAGFNTTQLRDDQSDHNTTEETSPAPAEPESHLFAEACNREAHKLLVASPAGYSTPSSALRKRNGNSKRNRVSFGNVLVRGYAVELGGGGGVPIDGSPLGLGWSFEPEEAVALDDWEEVREPNRIQKDVFMRQGYIPPDRRREMLLKLGFEIEDLERAAEDVQEVQALRKESVDEVNEDEQVPILANAFMWWWMVSQGLDSYLDE